MGWKAAAAESAASFDPSLNEQKASKSQNSGNLVMLEMLEIEVLDESHLITLTWATYIYKEYGQNLKFHNLFLRFPTYNIFNKDGPEWGTFFFLKKKKWKNTGKVVPNEDSNKSELVTTNGKDDSNNNKLRTCMRQ
jgi:hypothetical protein